MQFLSGITTFFSLRLDSLRAGMEHKIITKIICYVLVGGFTFCLFLGVHVGKDALKRSFYESVRGIRGVNIGADGVSLSLLPPYMKLDSLFISDASGQRLLYGMQRVVIKPKLSALLTGKAELDLTAASYGGGVRLAVSSGSFFDFEKVDVHLNLVQQSLDSIPFVAELDSRVGGTGNAYLTYSGSLQNMQLGKGTLKIEGTHLRATNPVPLLNVSVFDNLGLTGAFVYNNGKLNVNSVKLAGKPLNADLHGSATLNWRSLLHSNVTLESSLFVQPDSLVKGLVDNNVLKTFKAGKRAKIAISGQLTNPRLALK
ncbi:type II secretion system protein N [Halodesulfovibrio aestuarii]|uniref:Type II secretion system protein N n=2 Tax=Halodesulfovibrio aestuarii TaxID=126333 RepID=A0A8G2CA93_9BACT|nr:type II secretion system protein N [Halodesulfovibrio aestuarii]